MENGMQYRKTPTDKVQLRDNIEHLLLWQKRECLDPQNGIRLIILANNS